MTNYRKTILVGVAGVFCFGMVAARGLNISVNPPAVDWNVNGWVDLTISNITPGALVQVALLIDVDQNRALGPADRPLLAFVLQDGQTNRFGAAYMPADRDGLSNGVIAARFSYHGLNSPCHTIGSYLWVAVTNPGMPAAQAFAVIQDTSTVWVTGTVRSYSPPHEPIPAARVQMVWFSETLGFEPATWTDTNGAFRLYLPAGISTNDVRGVLAAGAGYLGADQTPDGAWLSAYPFWRPLVTGHNALTNPLYLAEAIPDLVYTISGRVVFVDGATTSPVPYTLVGGELQDPSEEEGADLWTFDVTGADGSFRLFSPAGFRLTLFLSPDVNMRGLVCELQDMLIQTQEISGVEVRCYPARSLARGRVVHVDSGLPVVGLEMFVFDEVQRTYGFGYTMGNGIFEVSALPSGDDDCLAGAIEWENAWRLGCVPSFESDYFTIRDGEVYTNILFELNPARVIRGRVFDTQTNALKGGWVRAFLANSWDQVSKTDVNLAGEYQLPVPSGSYRLQAGGFDGYLPMNWSNHFLWEWDNGPKHDPVIVTTADVNGIDYYIPQASYIRGTVRGEGVPIEDVEVRAMIGWSWRGSDFTDANGNYELAVLGGTNYRVQAEPPAGTFWLYQYYSNAYYPDDATPVYTEPAMPATNIDFNLSKGGRIEGRLFNPDGITAFTGSAVVAGMDLSNAWINASMTDPTAEFRLVLPPGLYRARADAPGWLPQYYGGYFDYQWSLAPIVTVVAEQVTGGLNITMAPPSYVAGRVEAAETPLSNVLVEVVWVFDTTNWFWSFIQNGRTRDDGSYTVEVPPGTNFAVRVLPEGGSGYTEQWWSNAPSVSAATLLVIGRGVSISNINFSMATGMRILGRVTDADTGAPVVNALVEAWRIEGDSWWWAGFARTDTNGEYAVTVPATTAHVVSLRQPWDFPFESWWYPLTYFSNTYFANEAQRLWTNAGASIADVNFQAHPGFQLTGHVVRAVGGEPVTNAEVGIKYNGTVNWLAATSVNDQGRYQICLPTNWPLYVRVQADGYGMRWYSNVAFSAMAMPIRGVAYTRVNAPFELATYSEDLDGDGYSEYEETSVLGTDPLDASDYLRFAQAVRAGAHVEIQWMSKSNVTYWIERCTDLMAGVWALVAGPEIGTGGLMTVTDTNAPANATYKIIVTAP